MSERSDSHVPEPLLHQGVHLPQARTHDLALFRELQAEYLQAEYLQAEYRDTAPAVDHDGPAARAERRADEVVRRLGDPAGARVLEIGCGEGRLSQLLVERHGCEVVGIDTVAHEEWSDRPSADLRRHDLPSGERTSLGRFDLIVSFGTWERLAHPYAALEEARALLADGGRMLLHAGLYRGPSGAGVAPDVAFPWPHLLFTDEVIADHRRQDLGVEPGAAWVNRLTTTHYTTYAERVGLRAEAAVADDDSRASRDLLDAVRYYAELAPEDYPAASLGSPDFLRYKEITLLQCAVGGSGEESDPPGVLT